MTKYNKRSIGDSFGCDWPEIVWKNRAKGPLKGFLGGYRLSSIFFGSYKKYFQKLQYLVMARTDICRIKFKREGLNGVVAFTVIG